MLQHHSQGDLICIFNPSHQFWKVIRERIIQRQALAIDQFGSSSGDI